MEYWSTCMNNSLPMTYWKMAGGLAGGQRVRIVSEGREEVSSKYIFKQLQLFRNASRCSQLLAVAFFSPPCTLSDTAPKMWLPWGQRFSSVLWTAVNLQCLQQCLGVVSAQYAFVECIEWITHILQGKCQNIAFFSKATLPPQWLSPAPPHTSKSVTIIPAGFGQTVPHA